MSGVTIAGQVAAIAAATDGQPPREVTNVMARQQAELAARESRPASSRWALCSPMRPARPVRRPGHAVRRGR